MKHIVALSGGKDSTAMALRLRELYPDIDYQYIFTPTGNELPDMLNHWAKLQDLLGTKLTPITTGVSLGGLIGRMGALPNWRQRWCTRILKIEPFAEYLLANSPATSYAGIRADEEEREGGDYSKVPGVIMRFPMREWGWTINDVIAYNDSRGIVIPKRTDCAVCFFQRIHEWYELWRNNPAAYAQGIAWEEATGHTFRSPGRDSWPAALKDLAREFESGRKIRGYNPNAAAQIGLFPDKIADMKCRVCRI